MAIVTVTIDTDENTISANIDGKEVSEVTSVSAYNYEDYYNKNKPRVSWNITSKNSSENDDFSSYVNYCSATASVSRAGKVEISMNVNSLDILEATKAGFQERVTSQAKTDIANYFEKRRNR